MNGITKRFFPAFTHLLLAGLVLTWPALAPAVTDPVQFDDTANCYGWIPASQTMDSWMTTQWCGSYQASTNSAKIPDPAWRDQVTQLMVNRLHLGQNYADHWEPVITSGVNTCNPDDWWPRLVNGGLLADWVASFRAASDISHNFSMGFTFNGAPVTRWLEQFVDPLAEPGFVWSCEHPYTKDKSGNCAGWTIASNPSDDDPMNLFYAFFWLNTAVERAGTIVHEINHELVGHVADSLCDNKGSCDFGFLAPNPGKPNNVNTQSVEILYFSQIIDAYMQKKADFSLPLAGAVPNFGGMMVKNIGPDAAGVDQCGYVPVLSEFEREAARSFAQWKLDGSFQVSPAQAAYPAAVLKEPDGSWTIDRANQAIWPCGAVCDANLHTFDPSGANPAQKGCNEQWQPKNVEINAANRAACLSANQQVKAGVTEAQRAAIAVAFLGKLQSCATGVPYDLQSLACDDAISKSSTMGEVAANYPIPMLPGFARSTAISSCQAQFCAEFASYDVTPESAAAACYEVDLSDPQTGCPGPCGALGGWLSEAEQFERILCRYAIATGAEPPLTKPQPPAKSTCGSKITACGLATKQQLSWEAAVSAWAEARANGECWFDDYPPESAVAPAYLNSPLADLAGKLELDTWLGFPGAQELLFDPCLATAVSCQALDELSAKLAIEAVVAAKDLPYPPPLEALGKAALLPALSAETNPVAAFHNGLALEASRLVSEQDLGFDLVAAVALVGDPEYAGALASRLGPAAYGALFGVAEVAGALGPGAGGLSFQLGEDAFGPPLGAEATATLAQLSALRQKSESPATIAALGAGLATADPADLYGILESISNASTVDELDAAFDELYFYAGL
jgi:hypothetical protein